MKKITVNELASQKTMFRQGTLNNPNVLMQFQRKIEISSDLNRGKTMKNQPLHKSNDSPFLRNEQTESGKILSEKIEEEKSAVNLLDQMLKSTGNYLLENQNENTGSHHELEIADNE